MLDHKIIQLDKDISNKIAAGEVVERPLAVVKELVENAIDAGSTKVTVEIKDAGKTLIRVTDNGMGIMPDDVELAFERHSTSKIRTINDIYHISSLGFRGEALASIASVSNMEVISKHGSHELGKKLQLTGGRIVENVSVGAPQGTTMMVKDLFFNTPARLKFLKSNNAEQNAINDIMTKLALSHPEVAFKYIVAGQNIFITPGNGKLYDVILNIYQRNLAKNLIEVNYDDAGIKLTGYVSTIDMTRGNRQYQISFVNSRYVKSKTIEDAVATVYRTLIPHNRFPIVFLNIEIDPSLVDINIHPAKTEIRFHQEGAIKDLIYKALKYEINKFDLVPEKTITSKPLPNISSLKSYDEVNQMNDKKIQAVKKPVASTGMKSQEDFKEKKKSLLDSYKTLKDENLALREEQKELKPHVSSALVREELTKVDQQADRGEKLDKVEVTSSPLKRDIGPVVKESLQRNNQVLEEGYKTNKDLLSQDNETIYDNLRLIGQIFNSYLIYEKNNQMYMIDQHAAHEKILYEKFVSDFRNKKLLSQMILEPIVVDVNKITLQNAMNNHDLFLNLGFNIEAFGDDAIIVREIPLGFDMKTSSYLIKDLIEKLDFSLPKEQFELALDRLATRSCKAAVKANDRLATVEINSLVDQLKGLNEPYTCPHGRPIIIKISRSELERKFNRT